MAPLAPVFYTYGKVERQGAVLAETLIEALPYPVFAITHDLEVLFANRRARTLLSAAFEKESIRRLLEGLSRHSRHELVSALDSLGRDGCEVSRVRLDFESQLGERVQVVVFALGEGEASDSPVGLVLPDGTDGPRAGYEAIPDFVSEDPRTAYGLTRREMEILELLRRGLTNREIGGEIHIAEVTTKKHISSILRKVGARNRLELLIRLGGEERTP
jgi:DNA-binding CsgD family transcriptional regulator